MKTLLEMTVPSGLPYDYQHEYAKQALERGYTEEDWMHQHYLVERSYTCTMLHSKRYHSVVKDSLDIICSGLGVSYQTLLDVGLSQKYVFRLDKRGLRADMTVDSVFLVGELNTPKTKSRLFLFEPGERIEIMQYRHCIQVSDVHIDYDYKTLDLDDDYASDSIEFPLLAMSVFTQILKCFRVK